MAAIPKEAKMVICGAGIAGISAAYFLALGQGFSDILLVDKQAPMSLTSDKSTECYRNWWPGPGNEMVLLMNRSISLMEEMASKSGNVFQMNKRGYLYATTDEKKGEELKMAAKEAASLGAGELRVHSMAANAYEEHHADGFESRLDGADFFNDSELILEYFPYLSPQVKSVLHVRRAGWLSAQQYGMWMLEAAKEAGVKFLQTDIKKLHVENNAVSGIETNGGDRINCEVFINAAGPHLAEIGEMLGVDIPIFNELHVKSGIEDVENVLGRDAPLVICADEQRLEWTDEERQLLKEDEGSKWLLDQLPSGAHARPEGALDAQSILVLWDTHNEVTDPIFPPEIDQMAAEIAVRGLRRILPGMQRYIEKMPRPFTDGGYYTKTKENRPLACPLSVEGAYVIGAASGYGIMASAALAELLALQIAKAKLPEYAQYFSLERYKDEEYLAMLTDWGESWQL